MNYDLVGEIQEKSRLLDAAIAQFSKRGMAYADSERVYRIALAKKILEYRTDGMPVTIISDLCRGDAEISRLRFERDCSEIVYKSAQEAINNYKLQIRILDAQVQREWGGHE